MPILPSLKKNSRDSFHNLMKPSIFLWGLISGPAETTMGVVRQMSLSMLTCPGPIF